MLEDSQGRTLLDMVYKYMPGDNVQIVQNLLEKRSDLGLLG